MPFMTDFKLLAKYVQEWMIHCSEYFIAYIYIYMDSCIFDDTIVLRHII